MYSQYKFVFYKERLILTGTEIKPRGRRKPVPTVVVEPENLIDEQKEIETPVNVKRKLTKGIIAVDNGGENTKVLSQRMEKPTYFKSKKRLSLHTFCMFT